MIKKNLSGLWLQAVYPFSSSPQKLQVTLYQAWSCEEMNNLKSRDRTHNSNCEVQNLYLLLKGQMQSF